MFPSASLLSAILLALSVSASPIPLSNGTKTASDSVLPFNINLNISAGMTLPKMDRMRAASLMQRAQDMHDGNNSTNSTSEDTKGKRAASFNVANSGVAYTASVGIGSPSTSYTLLLDTGSSNTWVGAGKKYAMTSSSSNTGNTVSLAYGSGQMSGNECAFSHIIWLIHANIGRQTLTRSRFLPDS